MESQFTSKELGIVVAVLDRFNKQRLPELLEMKDRVAKGGLLSDRDLASLHSAMDETGSGIQFAKQHPEFKTLLAKVTKLYTQISQQALENEKSGQA